MCCSNQYILLSESSECQVSYCKRCKSFSMMFKTACASFTAVELEQFSIILEGLSHQDFHYDVMGTAKAIVKNPYVCMGFCLSQQEANVMLTAVNESLTLYEAFNVIYR